MPYAGFNFPAVGSTESVLLTDDFINRIAPAELLISSVWTISIEWGVDAAYLTRLSGPTTIVGTKTVQRFQNPVPGVRYRLKIDTVTDQADNYSIYTFVDGADPTSALLVEDGTIVAGSNSYNNRIDLQLYARTRGRTIPGDPDLVEAYAFRAMDYLESFRPRFKGTMVDAATQTLSFPRTGVTLDGFTLASDAIPPILKAAQAQLFIDLSAGIELQPSYVRSSQIVKRRRAGPVEVEFFEGGQLFTNPQLTAFDAMIAPLITTDAQDIRRSLRI